jgi:hypothetical protein
LLRGRCDKGATRSSRTCQAMAGARPCALIDMAPLTVGHWRPASLGWMHTLFFVPLGIAAAIWSSQPERRRVHAISYILPCRPGPHGLDISISWSKRGAGILPAIPEALDLGSGRIGQTVRSSVCPTALPRSGNSAILFNGRAARLLKDVGSRQIRTSPECVDQRSPNDVGDHEIERYA